MNFMTQKHVTEQPVATQAHTVITAHKQVIVIEMIYTWQWAHCEGFEAPTASYQSICSGVSCHLVSH